jgi:AraC-like DNA-binding protein
MVCTLGSVSRRLGGPGSHTQHVARAVAVLRTEFALPLPVERLAAVAEMGPSFFHQHFRTAKSLSPRQFQKQVRLIEARRLMLPEGVTASSAAFAVGYESVSQFTREYDRMFGLSPIRVIETVKRRTDMAILAMPRCLRRPTSNHFGDSRSSRPSGWLIPLSSKKVEEERNKQGAGMSTSENSV